MGEVTKERRKDSVWCSKSATADFQIAHFQKGKFPLISRTHSQEEGFELWSCLLYLMLEKEVHSSSEKNIPSLTLSKV